MGDDGTDAGVQEHFFTQPEGHADAQELGLDEDEAVEAAKRILEQKLQQAKDSAQSAPSAEMRIELAKLRAALVVVGHTLEVRATPVAASSTSPEQAMMTPEELTELRRRQNEMLSSQHSDDIKRVQSEATELAAVKKKCGDQEAFTMVAMAQVTALEKQLEESSGELAKSETTLRQLQAMSLDDSAVGLDTRRAAPSAVQLDLQRLVEANSEGMGEVVVSPRSPGGRNQDREVAMLMRLMEKMHTDRKSVDAKHQQLREEHKALARTHTRLTNIGMPGGMLQRQSQPSSEPPRQAEDGSTENPFHVWLEKSESELKETCNTLRKENLKLKTDLAHATRQDEVSRAALESQEKEAETSCLLLQQRVENRVAEQLASHERRSIQAETVRKAEKHKLEAALGLNQLMEGELLQARVQLQAAKSKQSELATQFDKASTQIEKQKEQLEKTTADAVAAAGMHQDTLKEKDGELHRLSAAFGKQEARMEEAAQLSGEAEMLHIQTQLTAAHVAAREHDKEQSEARIRITELNRQLFRLEQERVHHGEKLAKAHQEAQSKEEDRLFASTEHEAQISTLQQEIANQKVVFMEQTTVLERSGAEQYETIEERLAESHRSREKDVDALERQLSSTRLENQEKTTHMAQRLEEASSRLRVFEAEQYSAVSSLEQDVIEAQGKAVLLSQQLEAQVQDRARVQDMMETLVTENECLKQDKNVSSESTLSTGPEKGPISSVDSSPALVSFSTEEFFSELKELHKEKKKMSTENKKLLAIRTILNRENLELKQAKDTLRAENSKLKTGGQCGLDIDHARVQVGLKEKAKALEKENCAMLERARGHSKEVTELQSELEKMSRKVGLAGLYWEMGYHVGQIELGAACAPATASLRETAEAMPAANGTESDQRDQAPSENPSQEAVVSQKSLHRGGQSVLELLNAALTASERLEAWQVFHSGREKEDTTRFQEALSPLVEAAEKAEHQEETETLEEEEEESLQQVHMTALHGGVMALRHLQSNWGSNTVTMREIEREYSAVERNPELEASFPKIETPGGRELLSLKVLRSVSFGIQGLVRSLVTAGSAFNLHQKAKHEIQATLEAAQENIREAHLQQEAATWMEGSEIPRHPIMPKIDSIMPKIDTWMEGSEISITHSAAAEVVPVQTSMEQRCEELDKECDQLRQKLQEKTAQMENLENLFRHRETMLSHEAVKLEKCEQNLTKLEGEWRSANEENVSLKAGQEPLLQSFQAEKAQIEARHKQALDEVRDEVHHRLEEAQKETLRLQEDLTSAQAEASRASTTATEAESKANTALIQLKLAAERETKAKEKAAVAMKASNALREQVSKVSKGSAPPSPLVSSPPKAPIPESLIELNDLRQKDLQAQAAEKWMQHSELLKGSLTSGGGGACASPPHAYGGREGSSWLYYDSPAAATSNYILRRHHACQNLARIAMDRQRCVSRGCLRVWRDLWTIDSFNELLRWKQGATTKETSSGRNPVPGERRRTTLSPARGKTSNRTDSRSASPSSSSSRFGTPSPQAKLRTQVRESTMQSARPKMNASSRDQNHLRMELKGLTRPGQSPKSPAGTRGVAEAGLLAISNARKARASSRSYY